MKQIKIFIFLLILADISLFAQNQNDFEFVIKENNGSQSITITKYKGSNINVIIPEKINNIPVTVIGDNSFELTKIRTIEMSNSIVSIGIRAFYGCQELTTVKISSSVINFGRDAVRDSRTDIENDSKTTITGSAKDISGAEVIRVVDIAAGVGGQMGNYGLDLIFDGCGKLTTLDIDPENPKYSSIDGVLFNKQKTKLLFYPHGKEGNYIIPEGVSEIGEGAFFNCKRLTSVFIPKELINIGMFNFFFCSSLLSFDVDINNNYFTSADGVLYSKNREKLIKFPLGRTGIFNVPIFVNTLNHGAFFGLNSDCRIFIHFDNITNIERGALSRFNFGDIQKDLETRFPEAFDLPMDIVFLFNGGAWFLE